MNWGDIGVVLSQLVGVALIGGISIVAAAAQRWINLHVQDAKLNGALSETKDEIMAAVRGSIQAMSAETEQALADGMLDKEDLMKVQLAAVAHYKEHISPALQKRIEAHVGDAKLWVAKQAASYVQVLDKITY